MSNIDHICCNLTFINVTRDKNINFNHMLCTFVAHVEIVTSLRLYSKLRPN